MNRGTTGVFNTQAVAGETWRTFIPNPLPPVPPIAWDAALQNLLQNAALALGKLESLTQFLPNPHLFLYSYVRKEALLSSQIEGTQSTFDDIIKFEAEGSSGVQSDDVIEVSCYVAAMEHGLRRLAEGFPLSLRLLREIHGVLLSKGRGHQKQPGEFRTSQNWIGGSRPGNAAYVPPPVEQMMESLGTLEKFLHDEPVPTPVLVKAALAHVQFETIHPFLDGNGRVGRLLITLLLCHEKILSQPLLYLSLHLKQNRDEYYRLLQRVRTDGEWEDWLAFFLGGVASTAEQATSTAKRLLQLFNEDAKKIESAGRAVATTQRMHRLLQEQLTTTITDAAQKLDISFPTALSALEKLIALGIARELTGGRKNRFFAYDGYLAILREDTEPL
ncbi:Fic family protein [Geminisphaera colitermitum]|uniref:Fic family protein n=1 Tax=Geminisphaera colitermitum TaxID=1148786 RepID=UPI0005BC2EBD|nr:Fic family protein [Geminisphaera colitermitum]